MGAHPLDRISNQIRRPAATGQGVGALFRRHRRHRDHAFGWGQDIATECRSDPTHPPMAILPAYAHGPMRRRHGCAVKAGPRTWRARLVPPAAIEFRRASSPGAAAQRARPQTKSLSPTHRGQSTPATAARSASSCWISGASPTPCARRPHRSDDRGPLQAVEWFQSGCRIRREARALGSSGGRSVEKRRPSDRQSMRLGD